MKQLTIILFTTLLLATNHLYSQRGRGYDDRGSGRRYDDRKDRRYNDRGREYDYQGKRYDDRGSADQIFTNPTVVIGFKFTLPITVSAESTSDLSFLGSMADGSAAGLGIGFGLFFEYIPIRFFAIETGINYRTFEVGGWDITYSEIQIPFIPKIRFPVSSFITVAVGVGGSYFFQFSGGIDPDGDGPGQGKIPLNKNDRADGFSFIARMELQFTFRKKTQLRIDMGYEYAKRSLNIKSHDIFFNVGMGIIVF